MIKILFAFFIVFNSVYAACSKINMPTDYSIIANGTRANLKANFDEVQTKTNPCMDSVDEVRGRFSGYTGSLLMSSLEHLRLRLDSDASTTGRFLVESGNGDSLFRVSEDSSAKVFGALSVAGTSTFTGAPTFSSIATGRIPYTTTAGLLTSGTGLTYNGSAFSVTGTGEFSGAVTMSSTLGVTGGDVTIGTNSTPYNLILNGGAAQNRHLVYQTAGLSRWKITTNSTAETGSNAGSDLAITAYNDAGSANGTALTITRSNRTVAIGDNATVGGTLGVTGVTTLTGITGIGVAPSASASLDIRNAGTSGVSQYGLTVQSTFTSGATTTGTALYSQFTSSGAFSMATGRGHLIATPSVGSTTVTDLVGLDVQTMSGGTNNYAIRTGASGLIQLGSLTASSAVATDASKNLISVTNTGTGNNVLSASPTLTGTIAAANQTLSGTLGVTGVTTATGGLTLGASFVDKTTSLTGNTTLTSAHSTIFASASGGSFTLTLPAASGKTGLTYTIYKTDVSAAATGGGNTVTIDGNASETVGDSLTQVLSSNTGYGRIKIICDGSNWRIEELYDEGSYLGTLTGCTTSPTGTIYYTRRDKTVTLILPNLSATSNTTAMSITGTPISLYPGRSVSMPFKGYLMDATFYVGTGLTPRIRINTSGSLVFGWTTDGTVGTTDNGFTASSTKGVSAGSATQYTSVTYTQL